MGGKYNWKAEREMKIPNKIYVVAERLRSGHRVNRITVRDFLLHFGAERRGAAKVQAIREILEELGLYTDPDFATAWIDAPIWIYLKDQAGGIPAIEAADRLDKCSGAFVDEALDSEEVILEGTPTAVEQADQQTEAAPVAAEADIASDSIGSIGLPSPSEDPTFRIGSLPAANKTLFVVNQEHSITKAITLMLKEDLSQLPVMQGDREVKGMITWKSICAKQALGCTSTLVKDYREDARIVDSNRTLYDAIPVIVEAGYVLVRDHVDRRITGIVTASDLSLQFQALAEPFLLIREIELHIRQLLGDKISAADLAAVDGVVHGTQKPQNIADLSFGQYVRLLQNPAVWSKLAVKIDSGELTSLLEKIRIIRNDVMHFDPDPMTADELGVLKGAVRFMQEIYRNLPSRRTRMASATRGSTE